MSEDATPPAGADDKPDKKPAEKRKPRKPSARKAPVGKAPAKPARRAPSDVAASTAGDPQAGRSARGDAGATQADRTPEPIALIRVPMPVRWRDLDAFNHVNNSKYLSYLEEARLRWMLSVPGQGLDDDVAPVVAAATLNYRRPIQWPNEVVIELFVERLGNTSVSVGHRILAADDPGVLFCDGNVVMVWIDRQSGLAAPLPHAVREVCSMDGASEKP